MSFIKPLPKNGFYAVIFSNTKSAELAGYAEMDEATMALAEQQPGYLGYESLSNGNKTIFISYWEDLDAIDGWRHNSTHILAKANAEKWYKRYLSQVCRVESSRLFENAIGL